MLLQFLFVVLMLICIITVGASLYFQYNSDGRKMNKIPGPKEMPVFANIFDLVLSPDSLFKFLRECANKYQVIYKLCGFHYRQVNILRPEDIESVELCLSQARCNMLREIDLNFFKPEKVSMECYRYFFFQKILSASRFNSKRLPYTFLHAWLGAGLLVSNGDKWHERRKMLTPAFHFKILKEFSMTINEQTEEFLKLVQQEVRKEKTEIQPLVAKTTLRIICETSMGTSMSEDIRSVANKYFKALHNIGQCIVQRITQIWLHIDLVFNLSKTARTQKAAIKDLQKFTKQIIQERRKFRKHNNVSIKENNDGKKHRMAMLDLLLEQKKLGTIDEDGIREEVDTFMFEGHDTTASALTFMIMRIANEPTAQRLIHEELERIFGDSQRTPTTVDLNEMKYLEYCIKESLRLYPGVPFINRLITEEVELAGYTIPTSTECNIHIFDIHRRPDIYPEPEKFIPERFLPENVAKRHPYAYIPFSAGPRNCIGQKFAMLEIKTLMSGLLRRFKLQPVTRPEDITFTCDLVLRANQPVYVRILNKCHP